GEFEAGGDVIFNSGLYIVGNSTFATGAYFSNISSFTAGPSSIFVNGGIANQVLKKAADGSMVWADDNTGMTFNTSRRIQMVKAGGGDLADSLFLQDADDGGITMIGISSMTIGGNFGAAGNVSILGNLLGSNVELSSTVIYGTLQVTGAVALSSNLDVTGDITAAYYQINGSTVVAILPGIGSLGIGIDAGRVNTGPYNVFVGSAAGYSNTSGNKNSFVGYNAGRINITGNENSFVGYSAGMNNTTGWSNSFLGSYAGYNNQTGSANAIFGTQAGYGASVESFSSSTIMGYQAGFNLRSGSADNLLLGFRSGDNLTSGARNIIIGYDEDPPTATTDDYLNIGGIIIGEMAISSVTVLGDLYAASFHGNASGLTNVPGDSLGNHIATTTLQMGIYDIQSSTAIN
ncbi:MAG: hypothetical protein KAI33_02680, partial [Elusimicrobiales bacterium]|nr:hypothetical protein [Elusimicrobiales bacterium]